MWEDNAGNPSIPPQLLRDFDVYGILEPQRVEATDAPLIDLRTTSETTNVINPFAAIPTTSNRGFTVVDAFENIFVTPQLVSNTPTSNESNQDFEDFFTKLESGQKIDWARDNNKASSSSHSKKVESNLSARIEREVNALFDDSGKNKIDIDGFKKNLRSDREEDPEDLYDTIILEKALGNVTISEHSVPIKLGNIKVLKPPNIKVDPEENKKIWRLKNHMQSQPIEGLAQATCSQSTKKTGNYEIKNLSTPNNRKCALNSIPISTSNSILFKPKPCMSEVKTTKPSCVPVRDLASLKTYLDDRKRERDANCTRKPSIFNMPVSPGILLELLPQRTMTKETKVFDKKRIVISDSLKQSYSKGPSLDVKREHMPVILKRIEEQKKALEARNSVQKRPILSLGDPKKSKKEPSVSLEPVVLTEDCNRDRLVANRTMQAFKEFLCEK